MKPLPASLEVIPPRRSLRRCAPDSPGVVCAAEDVVACLGVAPEGPADGLLRFARVLAPRDQHRTLTTRDALLRNAWPGLAAAPRCRHPRAMLRPALPRAAIPLKRTKVVTLTAMAPITEKIACQVADGMAS